VTARVGANDVGAGASAGAPLAGELQSGAGVALGLLLGAVGDGPPRAPGGSGGTGVRPNDERIGHSTTLSPPPHAKKEINRAVPSKQAVIE